MPFDPDFLAHRGSFIPILKLDSRAGVAKVRGPDNKDQEYQSFKVEVDLSTMESGWWIFSPAVNFKAVKEPPSPDHRRGAKLYVLNSKYGVLEVGTTASTALTNIVSFWHEAADHENKGENPLVEITFGKVQTKSGTTHPPVFEIKGWRERSPAFDEAFHGEQAESEPAPKAMASAQEDFDDDIPF